MVGNIVGCNGGGSACLVSSKEWSSVLAGRLGAGPAAPCRRLFRGGCGNGFGRGGRRRAQAQHAAGQLGQLGHHLGRAQAAAGAVPVVEKARQAAGGLGGDARLAEIQMAAGAAFFEQRAELAVETARQRARGFHVRGAEGLDRKSTRLNSSHLVISYAVFCLKQKNNT